MTEEELAPELRNHVKKITFNTITEVSQQQIALETNVVDTFMGLNPTIVHAFEENDQFKIITAPAATGNILYCSGHESRAIASDVNLRHAIFACIDHAREVLCTNWPLSRHVDRTFLIPLSKWWKMGR